MAWLFRTKEQIEADQRKKRERQQDKEIRRECKYYAELIPQVLANCGINHFLPMASRPTVVQENVLGWKRDDRIKIVETRFNKYAIYLWVDTRQLPWNTNLTMLYDPAILETLSDACGRIVTWRSRPGFGSWYVIWREGARNAIPMRYKFNEILESIPKNAPPLYYIAGIGENNRLLDINIEDMPHLLIGGSTFTGKSVHLNQMLCQLIMRNTPKQLQITMIDLKDGSEFAFYEGLPHLAGQIVTKPEDVPDCLVSFHEEMQRRRTHFLRARVKDIRGWNALFPDDKLSYRLLVFDELSLVMLNVDRKLVKDASAALSAIMATARSSGGHVVLCTQNPRTDVVPAWIKSNANGRICFAVPSFTDSIVVLDNGAASTLQDDVPGRAMLRKGPQLKEFQTPFITNQQISEIVRQAIQGRSSDKPKDAPPGLDEVLEEVVDNFGGKLNYKLVAQSFKGRLSRDKVEALIKSVNGGPVFVHGVEYRKVDPGRGRWGGARLVPVIETEAEETPRPDKFDPPRYGQRLPRWILATDIEAEPAPDTDRIWQP